MTLVPIRLAAGTITATAIRASSGYLVSNFPLQTDQTEAMEWRATTNAPIVDGILEESLESTAQFYGGASGEIKFQLLTPNMVDYLWSSIFAQQPMADVTLEVAHQRRGRTVYNCKLRWAWLDSFSGDWRSEEFFTNVIFRWDHGEVASSGSAFSSAFSLAYGGVSSSGSDGSFSSAFGSAFDS